jgi:hypothetical protein
MRVALNNRARGWEEEEEGGRGRTQGKAVRAMRGSARAIEEGSGSKNTGRQAAAAPAVQRTARTPRTGASDSAARTSRIRYGAKGRTRKAA